MKILEVLLESLEQDALVKDLRIGPFWTAVVSAGCGLAATVAVHDLEGDPPVIEAGRLTGGSARRTAQLALSSSSLERSIGVAAMNSLISPPGDSLEINALDLLLRRGAGKRVALVGHFPFVPRLREAVRTLWVLEKTPLPGDLPEGMAEEVVPLADLLAISASALVYGGLDRLLALRRPGALVVLLGPSAPLTPLWFDLGVDVVSGSRILDIPWVLRQLGEGAIFRQLRQQGIRLCTLVKPGK